MRLFYENTDITTYTGIEGCVYCDAQAGRADTLSLLLENADAWKNWAPQADDTLTVTDSNFTTGKLYLKALKPEGKKLRIVASSLPGAAQRKAYEGYENYTLFMLLSRAAADMGLSAQIYGADGGTAYPFLMRSGEGYAAFLSRLCFHEGAVLKAFDGQLRFIDLLEAQKRDPARQVTLSFSQDGVTHTRREETRISRLTVVSPYAKGTATDTAVKTLNPLTKGNTEARTAAQALRTARGLLLNRNRMYEQLIFETDFDPALSFLARVSVSGGTEADGEWMADEARHDLFNRTSRVRMVRVVESIV